VGVEEGRGRPGDLGQRLELCVEAGGKVLRLLGQPCLHAVLLLVLLSMEVERKGDGEQSGKGHADADHQFPADPQSHRGRRYAAGYSPGHASLEPDVGIELPRLVTVLEEARSFLAFPGNDFAWSGWDDARAALDETDGCWRDSGGAMPRRSEGL
jgi:hypothetical protein